jgi:hypothetical protein
MTLHGKWSQQGVPQKGWVCLEVIDTGEPSEICEMCQHQEIRYVHIMRHEEYEGTLRCGCVCDGNMSDGYVNAEQRQHKTELKTRRKEAAAKRKEKAEKERIEYERCAAIAKERERKANIDMRSRAALQPSRQSTPWRSQVAPSSVRTADLPRSWPVWEVSKWGVSYFNHSGYRFSIRPNNDVTLPDGGGWEGKITVNNKVRKTSSTDKNKLIAGAIAWIKKDECGHKLNFKEALHEVDFSTIF